MGVEEPGHLGLVGEHRAGAQDVALGEHHEVGAEQDAVLELDEHRPQLGGILAADLREARAEVGVVVGVAPEQRRHVVDVFGVVAEVHAHEGDLRVSGDHRLQLPQDLLARRIGAAAERPVGVLVQFLVAFVLLVDRLPERLRIAAVDRHRQPQSPGGRPHRVQPRVIDGDDLLVLVFPVQPKRLGDFSPLAPSAAARSSVSVTFRPNSGSSMGWLPIDVVDVEDEAAAPFLLERLLGGRELLDGRPGRQVHQAVDEVRVHGRQRLLHRSRRDVPVHIDDPHGPPPLGIGGDVLG